MVYVAASKGKHPDIRSSYFIKTLFLIQIEILTNVLRQILTKILASLLFPPIRLDKFQLLARAKILSQVQKSWRENVRNLLIENGVSFHFLSSYLHQPQLKSFPSSLPLSYMMPINYYIGQEHIKLQPIRSFLLNHGLSINCLTYVTDTPSCEELQLFKKCSFTTLNNVRLYHMHTVVPNSTTVDVGNGLYDIFNQVPCLKKIAIIDDCAEALCGIKMSGKIFLPQKLTHFKLITRREILLQALHTSEDLKFLTKLHIEINPHSVACECAKGGTENVLSFFLEKAKKSLKVLRLCMDEGLPQIKIYMPTAYALETLELQNIEIVGWMEKCSNAPYLPALQKTILNSCDVSTIRKLLYGRILTLKEFEYAPTAVKGANLPRPGMQLNACIIERMVKCIPECRSITLFWESMKQFQVGLPILFSKMNKISKLKLIFGKLFWQEGHSDDFLAVMTGLSNERVKQHRSERSDWQNLSLSITGITSLRGGEHNVELKSSNMNLIVIEVYC